jgi:hypothetical protein
MKIGRYAVRGNENRLKIAEFHYATYVIKLPSCKLIS